MWAPRGAWGIRNADHPSTTRLKRNEERADGDCVPNGHRRATPIRPTSVLDENGSGRPPGAPPGPQGETDERRLPRPPPPQGPSPPPDHPVHEPGGVDGATLRAPLP